MAVRWNEKLNSWVVEPTEGSKFETQNVLRTIPHRESVKAWTQAAGNLITDSAQAYSAAKQAEVESSVAVSKAALNQLGKGVKYTGDALSWAGSEYLLGIPKNTENFGPWTKEGLTKEQWTTRATEERAKLGLPLDPTAKANKEATNNAVNDVSTNSVDKGTSEADQWKTKTDYANNPEGYVKSELKEWTTDDPITKEAETVKGSEMIIKDPDGKLAEEGKIESEAIEMQPAANQGLKISKSQAADLMAMVGKKLMEPKARKGGPTDMNNPQWRAARGYGGSDFIRSWG